MYTVAAFYRFVALADPSALREELLETFGETDLLGTTLIAPEGINGTMAGSTATIDRLLELLRERAGLQRAEIKFSVTDEEPFRRLKFKLKREIITFRTAAVDPSRPGQYVDPKDWNELMADPEVLLLDTRNTYETEIGTFAGALTPPLATFSDFATYVRDNLDPEKHRKVAMFCTGGIRCEKASAFMLQEGFPEVYHLKGGILKYLEEVRWRPARGGGPATSSMSGCRWTMMISIPDLRQILKTARWTRVSGKHWPTIKTEPHEGCKEGLHKFHECYVRPVYSCHLDRSIGILRCVVEISLHSVAAATHLARAEACGDLLPLRCAPVEMTPVEANGDLCKRFPKFWHDPTVARHPVRPQ